MQLLCDTDFLIKVTNNPVPALRDYLESSGAELVTIPEVVNELIGLCHGKRSTTSRKAINALSLIGTRVRVDEEPKSFEKAVDADIALFERAKQLEEGSFVATLDGKLLSRFETNHLPYFTLRSDRPFVRSFTRAARHLSDRRI